MISNLATLRKPAIQPLPQASLATKAQGEASAADRLIHRRLQVEETKSPRWIWRDVDWRYTVDRSSSWPKKVYFWCVFVPFNRFSFWLFDLFPFNGRDQTGRLCWTEDFGAYETEWEAEQAAMRHPFGHAVRIPLNGSLPPENANTEQIHPNSPPAVQAMYERKTVGTTIPVSRLDMVQLAAQTVRAQETILGCKHPVT